MNALPFKPSETNFSLLRPLLVRPDLLHKCLEGAILIGRYWAVPDCCLYLAWQIYFHGERTLARNESVSFTFPTSLIPSPQRPQHGWQGQKIELPQAAPIPFLDATLPP